ncbi:hypothetical protein AB1L30_09900 [Bremerella sp. JC817]|uniref:hypothetical protein n=1 Tax=Bremerella sp. JC817 TaxID=3231756 RepID=UPI0034594D62
MINNHPQFDRTPGSGQRPALLITIDTEGDDLWSNPTTITTRNAEYLPRFQTLCERYGFRPTWLTNWEMVECPVYQQFASDLLVRNTGEVGMHLHAWNNPPLTGFDDRHAQRQPCLIEYPANDMRDKVARMTDRLEEVFQVKMRSHRAGRWGFDEAYAQLLVDFGYQVDCSVTPGVRWNYAYVGKYQETGVDYREFPSHAYWIDLEDIQRPGNSPLLELPMTIVPGDQTFLTRCMHQLGRSSRLLNRVANRIAPQDVWFRPFRNNRHLLPKLVEAGPVDGCDYLEMAFHSSELMPGGSPSFPNERSIEQLYERFEALFAAAQGRYVGLTLTEYHDRMVSDRLAMSPSTTAQEA